MRTLSIWSSEQESPLQNQPYKPQIILWIPLKGLYLTRVSKSNHYLPNKSKDIYTHLFMQHLIHTQKQ